MKLQFKRLHPDAQLPTRGSEHAAGYDLYVIRDSYWGRPSVTPGGDGSPCYVLLPGSRHKFKTGVAIAIPDGYDGKIEPRSGLALSYGIQLLGGEIDPDFRGEIGVMLHNSGVDPWTVEAGVRIAQIVLRKTLTPEPEWADELPATIRGDGGFGSSGV